MPVADISKARKAIRRRINDCLYYVRATKRINCTLTILEFEKLNARAKRIGIPVTACLKEMAFAYSEHRYLIPAHIEERLQSAIFLLRNIANNINQLAQQANQAGHAQSKDYLALKNIVLSLEDKLRRATRYPRLP